MSAQAQPNPMPFDDAYATVHQQVYAPVFFEKLAAEYGIAPQNAAEAGQLLEMAASLRQAHELQVEKTAAAQGSWLGAAQQYLNSTLADMGVSPVDSGLVEKAAQQLSLDPSIADAVLSLHAYAGAE